MPSTCPSTCSGQRWVGVGAPGSPQTGSPQTGWTQGWEPVAIKLTRSSHAAKQEVACLQKVRYAMEQLPGHHHVIQLLDSYTCTEPSGVSWTYIISRWVAVVQHHAQHSCIPKGTVVLSVVCSNLLVCSILSSSTNPRLALLPSLLDTVSSCTVGPRLNIPACIYHVSSCRYEEGYDLSETFRWMREKCSEGKGSARQEGHARWLLAVKSATRQAFQAGLGRRTFTLPSCLGACCAACVPQHLRSYTSCN